MRLRAKGGLLSKMSEMRGEPPSAAPEIGGIAPQQSTQTDEVAGPCASAVLNYGGKCAIMKSSSGLKPIKKLWAVAAPMTRALQFNVFSN